MESNDFFNTLLMQNDEAFRRTQTTQYECSRKIIDYRITLGRTVEEMAAYLNFSREMYIRLESGDTLPIDDYIYVLNFLGIEW